MKASEAFRHLGKPTDETVPRQLWVWLRYIELACMEAVDTSEVHPALAGVVDRVQHLRVALEVLCIDHGHDMGEVLDACKKPERRVA